MDDKSIFTGIMNQAINMWDLETGKKVKSYKAHKGMVYSL